MRLVWTVIPLILIGFTIPVFGEEDILELSLENTYENTTYDFSIKYPESWTATEYRNHDIYRGQKILEIISEEYSNQIPQINIVKSDLNGYDIIKNSKIGCANMISIPDGGGCGFSGSLSQNVLVNDKPVTIHQSTSSRSGGEEGDTHKSIYRQVIIDLKTENSTWIINGEYYFRDYADNNGKIDSFTSLKNIINSFKINNYEYDWYSEIVQESFTTSPNLGLPSDVNLILSNLPKVGETAQLTVEITNLDEKPTWSGEIISLGLTSGVLEFVDIPTADISHEILEKWGDRYTIHQPLNVISQNQTDIFTVTIKAVKEGIGRIGVSALGSGDSLPIGVTSHQGLMIDDYYELFSEQTPAYLSSITAAQLTSKNTGPLKEPEPIFPGLSPKKQLENGVTPKKITCFGELELIFKQNNSPVCVKPSTAEKLIERGWAR